MTEWQVAMEFMYQTTQAADSDIGYSSNIAITYFLNEN